MSSSTERLIQKGELGYVSKKEQAAKDLETAQGEVIRYRTLRASITVAIKGLEKDRIVCDNQIKAYQKKVEAIIAKTESEPKKRGGRP